jgi:hypothetical protein
VGGIPWTGDQLVARSLPTQRTTQAQNKYTQTYMPRVEFEPTISVSGQAKTVHALDGAATMTDFYFYFLGVGFAQPLTEMSTRSIKIMLLESRTRLVCRADDLTAICELKSSQ